MATIRVKRSFTSTNVPSTLAEGELAVNVEDERIWIGDQSDNPVELQFGGGASLEQRVVENPQRSGILVMRDGGRFEYPVKVPDTSTLEVYRWGAYDVSDGSSPAGLICELRDSSDTVQDSESTDNNQSTSTPVASYQNTSGSESVFTVGVRNNTGGKIDNPGVEFHTGFLVN